MLGCENGPMVRDEAKRAKAQEDEEELKAREGGEFSLNSFRSPLQAGDGKSNCNLPGLQVFFFCKSLRGG